MSFPPLSEMIEHAAGAHVSPHVLEVLRSFTTIEEALEHKDAPYWCYFYAVNVIKGRFEAGEAVIATDAELAYCYALDVIEGRWEAGEAVIATHTQWACLYALDVIKGRFEAAEAVIATDAKWAYYYARDVIRGDWPEANIKL